MCVTYSVGSFSLLNAIAGSYVERVPVVVINGAPSVAKRLQYNETGLLWHHLINGHNTDLNIYRNVTVAAERISNPTLAPGQIDSALRTCLTERRPVYLETTEDVYDLPCAQPKGTITAAPRLSDCQNRETAANEVTERLRKAQRPLVWAGVEIERYGLQDEFQQLVQQLNIPYVTSLLGKSVLAEDSPQYVGVFEGPSSPQYVQDAFNQSDYILALGMWLTDENLLGTPLPWDHMTLAARDSVRTDTDVQPQVTLADLIADLTKKSCGLGPYPLHDRPVTPPMEFPPDSPLTYQGFYDRIASFVDDSMVVCAGTGFNWFASSPLTIKFRSGYIAQAAYADIGYAVPAAIGVALATGKDKRVIVFAGDGGFQMTAQSISTMARLKLNPIIFVLDNGVYGIEQWLADPAVYKNEDPFYPLSVLHPWKYHKLPDVLGGTGWIARSYCELDTALTGALKNNEAPSLIQVCVPRKSIPKLADWKVKEANQS